MTNELPLGHYIHGDQHKTMAPGAVPLPVVHQLSWLPLQTLGSRNNRGKVQPLHSTYSDLMSLTKSSQTCIHK